MHTETDRIWTEYNTVNSVRPIILLLSQYNKA